MSELIRMLSGILLFFIGKGCNNLTSIYLARHIPTGTLVAVRITDLEKCSEELLKALQVNMILNLIYNKLRLLPVSPYS